MDAYKESVAESKEFNVAELNSTSSSSAILTSPQKRSRAGNGGDAGVTQPLMGFDDLQISDEVDKHVKKSSKKRNRPKSQEADIKQEQKKQKTEKKAEKAKAEEKKSKPKKISSSSSSSSSEEEEDESSES